MTSRTPPSPHTPSFNNNISNTILPPTSTILPSNPNPTPTPQTLQLRRKLTHLATPLAPLLSITSGTIHPSFPATILHYHLLTSTQLDALAHHYHQRTPCAASLFYPNPVVGRWNLVPSASENANANANAKKRRRGDIRVLGMDGDGNGNEGLEERRRRFGRFMGLRGCESPADLSDGDGDGGAGNEREQRAMEMWVAEEMRRRREREERELMGRGKGCW
ncbi:hypothetical protein XPA_001346 [Xanthoria parietina]